jgi:hypothetical protein
MRGAIPAAIRRVTIAGLQFADRLDVLQDLQPLLQGHTHGVLLSS